MPTYQVEALERVVHRNYYTVEADSKDEAVAKCQNGDIAANCSEVVTGEMEWISTENVTLQAAPAPGPERKAFAQDGVELSDGGIIEFPEENGDIRRRDKDGNMMDIRSIGDEGWDEWADLFDVTPADFQPEDEDE